MKNKTKVEKLKEQAHKDFLCEIPNSNTISVSMSQEIDIKGKDVEIIQFAGGGKGLLIDGVKWSMEVMLYRTDNKDRDIEKSFREVGLEVIDMGQADVEELLIKSFDGRYSSIHDFIERNNLKKEADGLFGEGWEADNDIEQIQELLNSIDDTYVVKHIKQSTKRDERDDNYIEVKQKL